ncbi:MAG: hypothetical protein WCG84_01960 [Candidatus Moraniibacteriota bacterium]
MDQNQTIEPTKRLSPKFIPYLGGLVIGILIGSAISWVFLKNMTAQTNGSNSYQAGFDAAKELALKSGVIMPVSDDIRDISGTVTEIKGNRITLRVSMTNPFDDAALIDRIVTVTADTKIFKHSVKDPKTYQAEMDEYAKKAAETNPASQDTLPSAPPMPPSPMMSSPASLADIAVGAMINVFSQENIKTLKEFSATSIDINETLPVVQVPEELQSGSAETPGSAPVPTSIPTPPSIPAIPELPVAR